MRQARIVGAERFTIEQASRPALQADDEILVRTEACGICSGDLMNWYLEKKIGKVLGHEMIGRVEKIGAAIEHVRPGDRVFLHHHAPCLICDNCQRGAHVHCDTWRRSAVDPGGMAEWIRVPGVNARHDSFAVNELTIEQALFIEPLGCSLKALRRLVEPPLLWLGVRPWPDAAALASLRGAIVGCGIMGLLNLAAARALGLKKLAAVEPDETRRRRAPEFGATEVFTPDEARTALARAADFVLIGPGQPAVIQQALEYVKPGGVALLFAPTSTGTLTELDLGELYFREVSLVPSYSCGPEETKLAHDWLKRGLVQPEPIITHRFDLDQVQAAYDTARRGGAALKVIVTFEQPQEE
ncbi:MAG: alcohol dehydrogenase catalytic domain-containing protein [Gemmataceae bacterium]